MGKTTYGTGQNNPHIVSDFKSAEYGGSGYVKLLRTTETEELLKEPECFLLLTQIALRAKRSDSFNVLGLSKNQAVIGDYLNIGLTEQKYRTAKNKLIKFGFITTKATNKGTIATLINTGIYNINTVNGNEQTNERVTNNQRTGNERVTTNKNDKNDKNNNMSDKNRTGYTKNFEDFWNTLPGQMKVGKKSAFRHYRHSVKNQSDYDDIKIALENYKKTKRYNDGHIQNGSTWFNNWRDWLDYKDDAVPNNGKLDLSYYSDLAK